MHLKPSNLLLAAVAASVAAAAPPAFGQASEPAAALYEREVFQYPSAGRPDPFRSLLLDGDLGIRIEDLSLRGIMYDPDPSRSVAFLTQAGSDRRIQARAGERVGTLRVLTIYPDRVDIVVDELGVTRRETLWMESTTTPGES